MLVYIAPTAQGAAGSNWVKIYEDGYNNGQWAVERLRANTGRHAITVPDIIPGTYLLRAEIIALHEAFFKGGAQFYMECVQIQVTSPGSKTLPSGVSIPGAYHADDPGVFFNLYNGFTSYPIPGPPVWDGASSNSTPPPPPVSSTQPFPIQPSSATNPNNPNPPTQPPPNPNPDPTTLQTSRTNPPNSNPSPPPASDGRDASYIYQQCGGANWGGPQRCHEGLVCTYQNAYYSQCLSGPDPRPASLWEQCGGGAGYTGPRTCHPGLECRGDQWYRQCVPSGS